MKRLFVVIAAVLIAVTASAKGGFGVTAGLNFNSTKIQDVKMDSRAGMNVGITYSFNLPLGFSLQPSLVYSHSGALATADILDTSDPLSSFIGTAKAEFKQTVGSVQLPISLQWGPDLIVARPFLDVTPYIGYALSNKITGEVTGLPEVVQKLSGELDYGIGLGAGLQVWKIQAIVRYNWNFGPMGSFKDFTSIDLGNLSTENHTYGGISVNVAFFF